MDKIGVYVLSQKSGVVYRLKNCDKINNGFVSREKNYVLRQLVYLTSSSFLNIERFYDGPVLYKITPVFHPVPLISCFTCR